MKDDNAKRLRANRVWLTADSCDLEEFKGQVERSLNRADYPFASDVVSNVLVYDGLEARKAAASPEVAQGIAGGMGRRLYRRPRHHRHPQRVPRSHRDR